MIRKYGSVCILLLFLLLLSCGQREDPVVITDKAEMIEVFAPVNAAISRFDDLDGGTIITEYEGLAMPGSNVVRDEVSFERTEDGMNYTISVTFTEKEPVVIEDFSEDGILPASTCIYYPREKIPDKYFDNVLQLTVSHEEGSTRYKVDYILEDVPENVYWGDLYTVYAVDQKGMVVEMFSYHSYFETKEKTDKKDGYVKAKLAEYTK